jgi:hypothetical protein
MIKLGSDEKVIKILNNIDKDQNQSYLSKNLNLMRNAI